MPPEPEWQVRNFLEMLDVWAAVESPPDDLRFLVTAWIMTRQDHPHLGVRRVEGFDDLWFGAVPDSDDGHGVHVVCTYRINEQTKIVRCSHFGTLPEPF